MPRIKSLEFKNHPIFGSTTFDFCRPSGEPAENIVFAGENGSGKTRFLEELYFGTKREYSVTAKLRFERQTIISLDLTDSDYFNLDNPAEKVTEAQLIASSDSDSTEVFYLVKFFKPASTETTPVASAKTALAKTSLVAPAFIEVPCVGSKSLKNEVDRFSLNSAYSPTEINYVAKKPVTGVTNETLDSGILKESKDIARDITQLLIDVASQDNDDLALLVREGSKISAKTLKNLRMSRFSNAFKTMFGDSLKYKTIRGNIVPVFEKDGEEITLGNLSSGEKQIVFRSTYLLRNLNNLTGSPVFLDEPELSMHPKWARKIYNFYKNLFVVKKRNSNPIEQTSQVFMATHSADIVESAISDETAVVVSLCLSCARAETSSSTTSNKTSRPLVVAHRYSREIADDILPSITIAEVKYFIFGIPSIDFHIQLYSYLQNYVSGPAVRTIDNFLVENGAPRKRSTFKGKSSFLVYRTLPTFIRNKIDHPEIPGDYSEEELEASLEFMIALVQKLRKS